MKNFICGPPQAALAVGYAAQAIGGLGPSNIPDGDGCSNIPTLGAAVGARPGKD